MPNHNNMLTIAKRPNQPHRLLRLFRVRLVVLLFFLRDVIQLRVVISLKIGLGSYSTTVTVGDKAVLLRFPARSINTKLYR